MAGEHAGHRQRMRERFLTGGLEGFADHEVLELMLFYAIPQRNVNPLAHRLLDRFGTLHAVLEAPVEELMKVLHHHQVQYIRRKHLMNMMTWKA